MSKPSKADLLIYKALNKAIEKDQLRIYLDYGKINRPGSPSMTPGKICSRFSPRF